MSVIEFEAEKALFIREVLNIEEEMKPYTKEELQNRIHKAKKEIDEGKGIAGDEVMSKLNQKIKTRSQKS